MSFLSTACDRVVKLFSFARLAVLMLILVTSCASHTQQKQISPASELKASEREETLPLVKPVALPSAPESHKRDSSQEIERYDNSQLDSAPIDLE